MKKNRSAIRVILVVTSLLAILAATHPAQAGRSDRVIGVGWNVAAGASLGKPVSAANFLRLAAPLSDEYAFDLELACLELRIFPGTNRVSIDLQWDLVQSFAGQLNLDGYRHAPSYMQNTYVHIHFNPDSRAAFALAPGLVFSVTDMVLADYVTIGATCRIGADVTSGDERFGLGIYARPAVFGSVSPDTEADYERVGFELVGEFTWTFYALKE